MHISKNIREYAPIVLRIGMALVFLWFGLNQIFDTENFIGYLPDFLLNSPNPGTYVLLNGIAETILGILLLAGLFIKPVSFLLALHLLIISISMGYNDIMIRDIGLTLATASIFLHGPDKWSLDKKRERKR